MMRRITDEGAGRGTRSWAFYSLTDESGETYLGLGLSVEIVTPGRDDFAGFSLPVLDVWYGRWV
jgi:hypothetical protein